jgi:hypothetical protein
MTVHTQTNTALVVKIGAATYECQLIDVTFTPPGTGTGTTTRTACPDGVVSEPGEAVNGSLTGNAFTDTTAQGLWTALYTAYTTGEELDYEITYFPGVDGQAVMFAGRAVVQDPPTLPFSKPGISKHPVNLALLTATMTRPTTLAAGG